MNKTGSSSRTRRLPNFCLNRIRPLVRVRSPPNIQSKSNVVDSSSNNKSENAQVVKKNDGGRKIMIVVDSSREAKGALQWSLSHTVQSQDKVVLLYVIKPSKQGEESSKQRAPSLKKMCEQRRPEVEFEEVVIEAKEKGPAIVEEARKQSVTLLVLGQKKRSMTWRLVMMWAVGNRSTGGVVEYCIQNADCMAIAVRRKSKKQGGYLITTKRHKDFWLLA